MTMICAVAWYEIFLSGILGDSVYGFSNRYGRDKNFADVRIYSDL